MYDSSQLQHACLLTCQAPGWGWEQKALGEAGHKFLQGPENLRSTPWLLCGLLCALG